MGIVRHLPNPTALVGSSQHHRTALAYGALQKELRTADYAFVTDVDEFLQINTGAGTLDDLIAAHGDPDVISVSELLFGFGGILHYRDALVTEQFLRSDDLRPGQGRARRGVKSIMRVGGHVLEYSNHRPAIRPDALGDLRWTDGAGRQVSHDFAAGIDRGHDVRGTYADAVLNHYSMRSGESLLAKFERGDAVKGDRMNPAYIRKRDLNRIENPGMARHLPGLRAALSVLREDATLVTLHDNAVRRHREKITDLRAAPEFAELWAAIRDRITTTGPDGN
jgi:hypothetical protein